VSALRVGLIGFGVAGRIFHAPLIAATEGLDLAAVVTSRADEVAAAHPGTAVVAEAGDLWDRCDLVVVAAPNRAHAPLAREALARGLAVVVDKPLAVSAAGAEALLEEARAHDGRLTAFHNRRWDDDFLTIRRLVEDGALGDLVRFESRFERFRPSVSAAVWRERGDPAEGGGVLLDLGPHLVDQALLLFGPARLVHAEVDRRRPGAAVDDDAFLALEHDGGVRSHLRMSAIAPLHGPRLAISGLAGGLETSGLDPQEDQLRAGVSPADPGYGLAERAGRLVTADGEQAVELERGDYPAFYSQVVRWVREGAAPPVAPEDALAGLHLLDAARDHSGTLAR
jgi:scyllo-inositol 2-dehydrogenase (NADP+)